MRIHLANADFAGCGFYRCLLPGKLLQERGHNVTIGPPGCPQSLMNDEDIFVIQRHYKPEVQKLVSMKKAAGIKVVFELDDDLWAIAPDNPAFAVYDTGEVIRREKAHRMKTGKMDLFLRPLTAMKDFVRVSDAVTASTQPLAKRLAQWNKRTYVLPNGIVPAANIEPLGSNMHHVRIAWHGSMHHVNDLKPAAEALRRILREKPNVILVIMGWVHPIFEDKEFKPRIEYYPWLPEPQAHVIRSAMVPAHIGIAPLEVNEFNLSKSNLKFLEFGAASTCPILQDVYPYHTTIEDMKHGMLVKKHTEKDWYDAITWAIDHPVERTDMAKRARDLVFEKYQARDMIVKWEDAYEKILRTSSNKRTWERIYLPGNNVESQDPRTPHIKEDISLTDVKTDTFLTPKVESESGSEGISEGPVAASVPSPPST